MEDLSQYIYVMRKLSNQITPNYLLEIFNTGIVDYLIKFLKKKYNLWEKIQNESLWLLCNILSLDTNVLENLQNIEELINTLFGFIDFTHCENFQQV